MGSLADECDVEAVSQECVEYGEALEELQELMAANAIPEGSPFVKEIASTVSQVKLATPNTISAPASAELKLALEEAREITAFKGLTFVEAAKEACAALEELHKIVGDKE
jgi:hypothetical protein